MIDWFITGVTFCVAIIFCIHFRRGGIDEDEAVRRWDEAMDTMRKRNDDAGRQGEEGC